MLTTIRVYRSRWTKETGTVRTLFDVFAVPHARTLDVTGRYLADKYDIRRTVGSASSADLVANHVLMPWMSVHDPEAPDELFASLVFTYLMRVPPKFHVGQRVKVRWSGDLHGVSQPIPLRTEGEVLDPWSSWPRVWVQFDGQPYPWPIEHSHIVDVSKPLT